MARRNWADLPVELLLEFIRRPPELPECLQKLAQLPHARAATACPATVAPPHLRTCANRLLRPQQRGGTQAGPPPARYFGSYDNGNDNGRVTHDWEQLPHLDGRIIFVGRGCSKSYEISLYPGLGLEEAVYFLDDYDFCSIKYRIKDDDRRNYYCWDNGKWSGTTVAPTQHPSLPSRDVSSYSSPIWLLP